MPLTEFCYIPSVATDAFYTRQEQAVHAKLVKLYAARNREKDGCDRKWRMAAINRVIKRRKEKLSELLKQSLDDNITRDLNPDAIKDRNIINLFCSELTRNLQIKPFERSDKIMIINVFFFEVLNSIIHNGFNYNGEHYIFYSCGAGMIRTKRFMAICERDYNRIEKTLMCGLTVNHINEMGGMNENKLLSYKSLMSSATDRIEDFDIDKCIVVEDFEMPVMAESDFIDWTDYSITRKTSETVIAETDGWGMCCSKGWRSKIVRAPWVKGLVTFFDFQRYLREECTQDQWWVTDIYGKRWNIILDDIQCILTKSMFKLYKFYPSWECYKANFKAYGCYFGCCKIEDDYIPKARINYQMLQSLSDMTDAEIERFVKPTVDEIQSVGQDYQTTMRLLGATEYNKNRSPMQEALLLYPELFRDVYNKEILKQTKKSLVKQAMGGRLRVNGKYLLISPDPVAFCEWLFKGEQFPTGLLADGEVYTNQFKDGDELDCLRSPHLYQEHAVRINKRNELTDKWLGQTKCVYFSCHDMISRILQQDFDGDIALVVKDKTLTAVAKRNMKGIVPLSYDLKKARGGIIDADRLYEGVSMAYTGGSIGPISNAISKVKNSGSGMTEEQIKVIAWLTMKNNQVIDFAKTLWKSEPPKEIDNIIKSYTKSKLPHFFIYAKDKEPWQVESPNDSTMNRISKAIPPSRVKYSKSISKFDWRVLTDGGEYTVCENAPVIKAYNYCLRHQYQFNEENDNVKGADTYAAKMMREKILTDSGAELAYVVNSLVAYLYTVKQSSNKRLLWDCFGWDIVGNIHSNVTEIGRICPICGKRFKPTRGRQDVYCSDECYVNGNRQKTRERKESLAVKVVESLDNPQYFVVDNKN